MILESLFKGTFYPEENIVPKSPEYVKEMQKVNNLMTLLELRMKAEDYDLIEEMRDCLASAQCWEDECFFKYGFSAGMRLMVEVHEMLEKSTERMNVTK